MPDRVHHAVQITVDLVVPEPKRAKAAIIEKAVAPCVLSGARIEAVLRAVDLDDEPVTQTDEIEDLTPAWRLTAEVVPVRTQLTQAQPKLDLLRGHAPAQLARALVGHSR
jgi:hypothetical protein